MSNRVILRSTKDGYRLSSEAQRMLNKIHTADYSLEDKAKLLGYLSNEFYYNGANPNLCNRWLANTISRIAIHYDYATPIYVDTIIRENQVNIFR